jgi:uncharacterized protein YjbI with pentapeptide repeats
VLSKFTIFRHGHRNIKEGSEHEIILQDTATSFDALVQDALTAGVDLSGAELEQVNLHHCRCSGAQLANSNLTGANLVYAHFSKANLREACLLAANLAWGDFSGSDLSGASLIAANLAMTCLNHCNFEEANLEGVNLWKVRVYTGKWTADRLYEQSRRKIERD